MNERKLTTAQIAMLMVILSIVSKGIGFARELVLANYYGAGMVTDAYVMASQIPGTLLASLMTACGTAYMPLFSEKYEKEGPESANLFTSRTINFLFIVNVIAVILGSILAGPLVDFFAPGFDMETRTLTIYYLRIAFWLLLGNVFVSVLEPFLQYKGRFLIQVILGFFYSGSIVVAVIISAYTNHYLLIWGVVFGYSIRGFFLFIESQKQGFHYSADFHLNTAVKEALVLALPVFIGGSVSQINTFIDRILASNFESGSVSALNYGTIIVGVICSLSTTVIITIIYPKLNNAFALKQYERIGSLTEGAINLFAIICIPFTLGAMVYAKPVIQVVYERGAFSESATALTATTFFFYSIGIMFISLNGLLTKVYYSMHDTKTTVYCSVSAVIINIILNFVLSRIIGVGGLAFATSIAQAVNAMALYFSFKRKYPEITLLRSKRKLIQIGLFAIIAVSASYAFYYVIESSVWMPRMVLLGFAVIIAAIIYFILLLIAKFEELNLIKDLIRH